MLRGAIISAAALTVGIASAATATANIRPSPLPLSPGCYTNSDGVCVEDPDSNSSGATATCRDGTDSHSRHHSGTCSGHGGVAQWLSAPSSAPPPDASPAAATGGDGDYVAVAFSPISTMGGWGTAGTRDLAKQIALNECQTTGDGCQVMATARDGCAAYAFDPAVGEVTGGWGADPASAGADAMNQLNAGHGISVHCAP